MRFNISTRLDNGVGLEADYKILRALLESWGHQVNGVHHYKLDEGVPDADINIFLELVAPSIFCKAKQNWYVPNPEWHGGNEDVALSGIDKVLCKTHEAYKTFEQKVGSGRCCHVGWESRDLYDPLIPRQRKFLHVAGGSSYKNSEAVVYLFSKILYNPWNKTLNRDLVFVGTHGELVAFANDRGNIKIINRVSDDELKRLMNECLFHVMCSSAEGWGHVIHEGLGCGAVMITTDYPPMNEFTGAAIFAKPQKVEPCGAANRAFVVVSEVQPAVEQAWNMSPQQIEDAQKTARDYFLQQRTQFHQRFKTLVDGADHV